MTDTPISPAEGEALPTTPREPPPSSQVFYLGCENDDVGHYLWSREWRSESMWGNEKIPRDILDRLDGGFVPKERGCWQSSRVSPWFIISRIDNTVDRRPGSHSTFVGTGFADEAEFIAAARAKFPSVFARLKA